MLRTRELNQKGFSHHLVIILAVVLLAAGGVGYYVWQRNNDIAAKAGGWTTVASTSGVTFKACKSDLGSKWRISLYAHVDIPLSKTNGTTDFSFAVGPYNGKVYGPYDYLAMFTLKQGQGKSMSVYAPRYPNAITTYDATVRPYYNHDQSYGDVHKNISKITNC